MRIKINKLLRVYCAVFLALVPIIGFVEPVKAAGTGQLFLAFDSPSVRPGQQNVPVYIYFDSGTTDVRSVVCELTLDPAIGTYSHGTTDNGSFSSDFAGPNLSTAGSTPGTRVFVTSTADNSNIPVPASANMSVYVLFYDLLSNISGDANFNLLSSDPGCNATDAAGDAFDTVTSVSNSLDISGVTVTETSGSTNVTEGGATDTYTVVLDAEPSSNVTIDITDDAQTNVDQPSLVFTNGNWNVPQTVTVSAQNDTALEGNHTGTITMAVNASSDPLYTGLPVDSVTANITDNDGLVVEFTTSTGSDNEAGGGNLPALTVSGGDTTGGASQFIDVSVTGGTATGGGSDYAFTSPTTVEITAGNYTTPQTVAIPGLSIADDSTVEPNETIIFGLSGATSGIVVGDADGANGVESTHTYTINNDDGLLVELSTATASGNENGASAVPTLLVSGADTTSGAPEDVVVTISGGTATAGSDYTYASPVTVTIPADDYTTPQAIPIGLTINGDAIVEANETIELQLGSPSGGLSIGDANGNATVTSSSVYTITNDDQLTAELTTTSASDSEASGGNIPQILINGTSEVATTIRIDDQSTGTASNGVDYTLTDPVDVNIPAGAYNGLVGTAVDVPLTITNDQVIESNETINITLSSTVSNIVLGDVDGANGTESSHTYTITNDDALSLEFDLSSDNANEDDGYTPQIRVGGAVVTTPLSVEVTITGGTATGGGADYSFTSPQTVVIPIGDYTSGTSLVDVPGLNLTTDGLIEPDETIVFGLQNPSTNAVIGDADGASGTENVLTFTINNDDGLLVEFVNSAANDNENSGGNLPQVIVSGADTTGGSPESIQVTVTGGTATGGGDDYSFTSPTTINIPAGNYVTPQTFPLTGLSITGDTTVEPNETIIFGLSSPTAGLSIGDADGVGGVESTHTYTINNDDGLLVEFSTTSATSNENTATNIPTLIVSGADISGGSDESVDITVQGTSTASGAGSDYTLSSTTITIPADDYTTPQAIPIGLTITGDTIVEADEVINMQLSGPSGGISVGDADGANGIENTHAYTITNDDQLSAEFSTSSASASEATGGNIPVILVSGMSAVASSVTVDDLSTGSATRGNDYTFTDPTVVNIPAGTYDGTPATALAIGLSITDDGTVEVDETIILSLAATTNTVLADIDSANGIESTHTYTILNDDISSADTDNDGISNSIEDAGPNGGDANGDSIPDSTQPNVTSLVNPVTGVYNALEITSGCMTIGGYAVATEAAQSKQDGGFDYPQGMHDFTLNCASAGNSATVTVIFDRAYDTTSWSVRKFHRGNGAYGVLSAGSFSSRTIGGTQKTILTYSITDGGPDDEDNAANAVILDPVGVGVVAAASTTLPNTGQPLVRTLFAGSVVVLLSAAGLHFSRRYVHYTIRK